MIAVTAAPVDFALAGAGLGFAAWYLATSHRRWTSPQARHRRAMSALARTTRR